MSPDCWYFIVSFLTLCKIHGLWDFFLAICYHLKWVHIHCFSHSLQLRVKTWLKLQHILSAATACRQSVAHSRWSTPAGMTKSDEHSFIQDMLTRWNSMFIMFQQPLKQRLSIYVVLHNPSVIRGSEAIYLDPLEYNCLDPDTMNQLVFLTVKCVNEVISWQHQ